MVYRILLISSMFLLLLNAKTNLEDLKTFQADFIQDIKSTSGKNIEYKGKVFVRNDGRILWKYKSPIVKNVYILKTLAIIDEPELEQAIYTELKNEINIIKILQKAKKVKDDIFKTTIDKSDYFIEYKDNQIKNIKYKDELENNITIKFTKATINKKIDDKVFKFTAPEFYDIIRK